MRFRDRARLDTTQIGDRRGARVGGGRRGAPMAIGGGGIGGILVLLLVLFLTRGGVGALDIGSGQAGAGEDQEDNTALAASCEEGSDANQQADCRIVGVVNSVQAFWTENLPSYRETRTIFFEEAVETACGNATSAVGPFYCPPDEQIYIDLGFYDQLRRDFGAKGGPFAEAYVIAHEYGHHVENILGYLERGQQGDQEGPQSASVRVELMADCLAGMWAKGAVDTGFILELTQEDIADGLDAAAVIGDDRIQEQMQGQVNPESWTHGSSAQRQEWFLNGYEDGTISSCDTFAVRRV